METINKKIDEEFSVCDTCGYDRGFHVSFVKEGGGFQAVLICPECGQRFRVGWATPLG